jgi:MFS family permease
VLVGAAFLVAVGFGLVAPALPTFARSFDVGITAASAVISAFSVFRLGFAPVSGRLVTALGERRVFLFGLVVVAASTGACALAQSYWQLLLFRAVGGIGSTMFSVSAMSLLFRLAPPRGRARASGLWSVGFLLGTVTGPLVGGGLVVVSLRAPFVVYAIALVVTAVVSGVLLRGSEARRPTAEDTDEEQDGGDRSELRRALRHPSYRAALLASFANGWAVFGVRVALVPLFVVEALRQAPSWAGFALTVFAGGNGVGLLVASRWADRGGRKPPLLAGLALISAGTCWLGFTGSLPLFLVAALVGGVGSGLLSPSMNASVADILGPKGRGGPVLAGFQMVSDLGSIIGPVVAGAVAEESSYGVAFAVTGAVPLLALAAWLRAPETLPARAR